MSEQPQTLRGLAEKLRYSISDFPVRDLAFQDAAEELDALADAMEARLGKIGLLESTEMLVRRGLIGEKKP